MQILRNIIHFFSSDFLPFKCDACTQTFWYVSLMFKFNYLYLTNFLELILTVIPESIIQDFLRLFLSEVYLGCQRQKQTI